MTDYAKLADEIEALAKEYQDAREYIRAVPSDCRIPFDKMMELESAERDIMRACMRNTPTIISALRELEAAKAQEATDWQPIETAPKDGRSLMVWVASDDIAGPHVLAPISITAENAWWDDATCDRIEPLGSVTHWRPLPDPPARAAIGGGG